MAAVVFKPWGGSPEELRRNLLQLRGAERERRASVERFREIAGKVEKARKQSDDFFREYFLERRTAYSGIVSELSRIAQQVGIQAKEHTFTVEPVEGSENLAMLIITGHYEGSYGNLVHFVNEIDRTERFITIESMQATPQQSGGTLNINVKLNAFVVGEGEEL
jgi:Tfp pilus assembly protein PilO